MDVGTRIKNRRLELGMSVLELAQKIGRNKATIYRYENGDIENMPFAVLAPIAQALKCDVAYLMGIEDDEPDVIPINTHEVPMLGEISCGQPIIANEVKEDMAMLSDGIDADFALKCKGDSMINARIHDGDIVFLKKVPGFNNGDIVAVIIDDETTLKRIYMDQANATLTLVPENPIFPVLRFYGEEIEHIRVIGKAVAFQSVIR